jgi:hypothetical protein
MRRKLLHISKQQAATRQIEAGGGSVFWIEDVRRHGVLSTRSASIMGFDSFVIEVRALAEG